MTPSIAIAGVDTLIGQQIAHELQHDHQGDVGSNIRALYNRNNSDMKLVIEFLQTHGCELQPVEYHEVSSMEQQLRGRDYAIVVPPMQGGQQPMQWQQETERLLQAAKNSQVKSVILISYIGCDQRPEKKHLGVFEKIEKKARELYGQQLVILRINFVQQLLRLWAKDIQEGELRIPFPPVSSLVPIDIGDVARVIAKIIKGEHDLPREHRGQVYHLTGPTPITGKRLAECLGEASGHGSGGVQLHETDRDQVQTRIMHEWRQMLQQRQFDPKTGPYTLSESFVELVMDQCEVIREGKLQTSTPEVKRLTGQEPMPVEKTLKRFENELRSHDHN